MKDTNKNEMKKYRGIVEPHFRYRSSFWVNCLETRPLAMQTVQHRAARIVTNSSYDAPVNVLIKILHWPFISDIIN